MALKRKYVINLMGKDVEYENAYHMIHVLSVTKGGLRITVNIYSDSTKEYQIDTKVFKFEMTPVTTPDLIQFGYNLLKTLPEYDGSEDVFEEGQPIAF